MGRSREKDANKYIGNLAETQKTRTPKKEKLSWCGRIAWGGRWKDDEMERGDCGHSSMERTNGQSEPAVVFGLTLNYV